MATQLPITPKYYEPSGHLSQPERRSIWPIAAGLAVLMLGGAAWVLRPPTAELPVISSSSSPTVPPVGAAQSWGTSALTTPAAAGTSAAAETPTPTPGGEGVFGTPALQEPAEIEPALPDAASALTPTGSVAIQKVPSPPVASRETTAATKTKPQPTAPPVRSTPVEAPVAARELADALPPPPPPNIGGPRRATADSTVASTPQIDSVTRAGSGAVVRTVVRPESTAPTPDTAPAASAPVQTPPSGTTPTPTQSAITTPAIAQIDLSPPPATDRPSIVESAGIPSYRPPTPIQSPQPSYPPRALKRGDQGTIVLKVLVNEEGRVTRVVVDQGIAGSELEAAAIDAVLRWTYQPASEYGRPIKGWTTERFVFTPPSSKAD